MEVKPAAAALIRSASASSALQPPKSTDPADAAVLVQVYALQALVSPCSLYKSVAATPQMSSQEVIRKVLERYGDTTDPRDFELKYAIAADADKKKSPHKMTGGRKAHVLADDESPVLVAEWFTETNRRFELHRKETKKPKKWSLGSMSRGSSKESHIWTITSDAGDAPPDPDQATEGNDGSSATPLPSANGHPSSEHQGKISYL